MSVINLKGVPPQWRYPLLGVLSLVTLGGVVYLLSKPSPDRVLCPINPSEVENPRCQIYRGQSYPDRLYRLTPAVKLDRNQLGLYKNYNGEIITFEQVGFNPYPAEYSVVYPQDVLLYKTERETDNEAKCPPRLTRYGLCDTPIDGIVFGSGIEGVVDIAITFQIQSESKNIEQLYDIGGLTSFIDQFKQIVRANRQLTDIEPRLANSTEGAKQIELSFRQALEEWSLSRLISIESIGVRGITVGSPEYRQKLAEENLQIDESLQTEQEIEQEKAALAAKQELEKQRQEFERDQKLQDAENLANSIGAICDNVTPDRCSEMVWVLLFGGQIPPVLTENGDFIGDTPPNPQSTTPEQKATENP